MTARVLLWLFALGLGLLSAREAAACKPFIAPPVHITSPVALDSEIETESVTIRLECENANRRGLDPGALRCQLRSTHRLVNRGSHAVDTVAIISVSMWTLSDGPTLRLASDAGGSSRPASKDEQSRWRVRMDAPLPEGDIEDSREIIALDLRLGPGQSVDLALDGPISIERSIDGCATPSVYTRHRLVSPDDTWATIVVEPPPGHPAVPYDLQLEVPIGWYLARGGAVSRGKAEKVRGTRAGRHGYRQSIRTAEPVHIDIHRSERFVRGGPVAGVGLDLGGPDGVRPRLRAGWEVAAPWPAWTHAVAVESDLRSVTLVPSTQVASPNIWAVFPAFGIGLGAPVRLWPEVRAGVRTLVDVHWSFVGLAGTLDIYPSRGRRPELRGGVMLTFGL